MRPPKYDHAEIWRLGFIEGQTPKEIAEKLNMPDFRQVQKILRTRAETVISPERSRNA